jgi:hypothetical protein
MTRCETPQQKREKERIRKETTKHAGHASIRNARRTSTSHPPGSHRHETGDDDIALPTSFRNPAHLVPNTALYPLVLNPQKHPIETQEDQTHLSQTVPGPIGPGPHFSTHLPSLYLPTIPHCRHILCPWGFVEGKGTAGGTAVDEGA